MVLIPAIVLFLIAIWIILPAFHLALLPFAIGAPEFSPWLLLASLGLCAMTFNAAHLSPASRTACRLAGLAAALYAYPLVRTPFALNTFDGSMEQGLGGAYADQIPPATRATLRTHALAPRDFVRG